MSKLTIMIGLDYYLFDDARDLYTIGLYNYNADNRYWFFCDSFQSIGNY